jgi:hypothetical protein
MCCWLISHIFHMKKLLLVMQRFSEESSIMWSPGTLEIICYSSCVDKPLDIIATINHPRSSHSAELRQARNHICSRVLPLCLANEVVLTAKSTCASRFISELPLNVEIYRGTALTHCRNGPKWVRTSFSHEWNSLSFRLSTLVLYHSVLM